MKTTTLILTSLFLLTAIAAPTLAAPVSPPPGYGTCHIEADAVTTPITVGPITFTPFVPRLVCYW